jgi:hypothetical protein
MFRFWGRWQARRLQKRSEQRQVNLAVRCVETGTLLPPKGRLTGAPEERLLRGPEEGFRVLDLGP